ncbi:MAG: response regulator [Gammaproteobacteria bacterium]|nr:response regulator [Gammaproteobacteria bacterium]MCP5135824.1 response regulator [Gammaproteobacteria bacterium]
MGIRLLLIEDDAALGQILSWHFEDLGCHVTVAPDCAAAASLIGANRYDLVLMDYQLPDGVSLSLLPKLRETQPESPLVLMSAVAEPKVVQSALESGVSAFAPKPVDPATLATTLEALMVA